MPKIMKRLSSLSGMVDVNEALRDAHFYGGVALVAVGCYWLDPSLGLIAGGVGLIYAAVRG